MFLFNSKSDFEFQEDSIFLHYTGEMFGIGCSVYNEKAIKKILLLKKRKKNKPFIVLIPDINWLNNYGVKLEKQIRRLLEQYWPGALSVILQSSYKQFSLVTQNNKVAFRIPTDKLLREFIVEFSQPIISTSINIAGNEAKHNFGNILKDHESWFDFGIVPKNVKQASGKPSTLIDASDSNIRLIREGKISFNLIKRSYKQPQILFVCTANICRSPIAEYYAKKKFEDNYHFRSAGFLLGNQKISKYSRLVLQENNIDASKHISTKIDSKILENSWLILTMTKRHKIRLLETYPNIFNKVFTLSEYVGLQEDVEDPYGEDIKEYRRTYLEIIERINLVYDRLDRKEN